MFFVLVVVVAVSFLTCDQALFFFGERERKRKREKNKRKGEGLIAGYLLPINPRNRLDFAVFFPTRPDSSPGVAPW